MDTPPLSPSQARRLRVADQTLAVTDYPATGPALVLIHGIGSRDVSWWPVIDGLTPHFHVYALDLRGHGASDQPAHGYRLEDYASDLGGALDALELSRPRIMGHSLGALTTFTWAASDPARAAALVLEDPPLRTRREALGLFDEWMALNAMSLADADRYYQEKHPTWTAAERQRRAVSITSTAPAVFTEARARWERILTAEGEVPTPLSAELPPTLLVGGDVSLSGLITAEDIAFFSASVPRGEAVVLPGTSHSVHRDDPAGFLAAVVPFLLAND